MAGFSIVILMLIAMAFFLGVAFLLPLIVGAILVPKDSDRKVRKALLFWIGFIGIELVVTLIMSILYVPFNNIVPFNSVEFNDGNFAQSLLSFVFRQVPLVLITLLSIVWYKKLTTKKLRKLFFFVLLIQAYLMSYGVKMTAFGIAFKWIIN